MAVLQGKQRLDATLSSPALVDKDNVFRLVSSKLAASGSLPSFSSPSPPPTTSPKSVLAGNSDVIGCACDHSHNIVQSLSTQVWNLLELFRSASGDGHVSINAKEDAKEGWKLKHHTGQLRVMYREGPQGTPFHSLLAEGLIYSPITSALCLAWEVPSYDLWWPQLVVPSFKLTESRWIKRGFNGEDLSLIRVKVPWPLAAREVLLCAFELEVFDEDLIIVLLHSFPDAEQSLCGGKPSEMPDTLPDIVRMELAGGFALQRVSQEQSYFRTIANLDIKLDLVPPWLINFMSRQLIAVGFNLYQKTLASINEGEERSSHFQSLIETEPMYKRIRKGLESKKVKDSVRRNDLGKETPYEGPPELEPVNSLKEVEKTKQWSNMVTSEMGHRTPGSRTDRGSASSASPSCGTGVTVDPEVQKALSVLDQMISLVQSQKIGGSPIRYDTMPATETTTLSSLKHSVSTQCDEMDDTSQNDPWTMANPPKQGLIGNEGRTPTPESLKVVPQRKWSCLDPSLIFCGHK